MTSRIPPSRRNPEYAPQRAAKVVQQQTAGAGRVAGVAQPGVSEAVAAYVRGRQSGTGTSASAPATAFYRNRYVLSGSTPSLSLTKFPVLHSAHVYLNGLEQDQDVDYTLTGGTLDVLTAMGAESGDILDVRYAYLGLGPGTPAFSQSTQAVSGGSNALTFVTDTTPTDGQLLVAVFNVSTETPPDPADHYVNVPTGWVLVDDTMHDGLGMRCMTLKRVAGGAETGSYSFTFSVARSHSGVLIVADADDVVDFEALNSVEPLPTIVDPVGGRIAVAVAMDDQDATTSSTWGSGWSTLEEVNGSTHYMIAGQQDLLTTPGQNVVPPISATGIDLSVGITLLLGSP